MNDVIVSHSEVDTYIMCQRRHYYAFGVSNANGSRGLEPRSLSVPLYRGIVGHGALEVFFNVIMDGGSKEAAYADALSYIDIQAGKPDVKYEVLTNLKTFVIPNFFNWLVSTDFLNNYQPVETEVARQLEIKEDTGTYLYPFKPDLIIRDRAGNKYVVDYKFVYDFYHDNQVELIAQIPKYIGALRALGIPIKGGFYLQLRHREVKDRLNTVKWHPFTPTNTRVQNSFRQQYEVMKTIGDLKNGSPEDWDQNSVRALNAFVCKFCPFQKLCAVDLNGENSSIMRRVEFKPNTYGYSRLEE